MKKLLLFTSFFLFLAILFSQTTSPVQAACDYLHDKTCNCSVKTDPGCPAAQDPTSPFYGTKADASVGVYFKPSPEDTARDLYGTGGVSGTANAQAGPDQSVNLARWLGAVVGNITNVSSDNIFALPGSPNSKASAVNFFANGIVAMVTTRPASSIDYVAYEMNRLRVPGTPEIAYADSSGSTGFLGLQPILRIWTLFRNLAYLLFAIVFIVVGVMIMTRQKIDPKTAATIQNSLPKIIFALILVTFSYAIAGFLIDIMYVLLALIITLIGPLIPGGTSQLTGLFSGSIFNFIWNDGKSGLWFTAQNVSEVIKGITDQMFNNIIGQPGVRNGTLAGLITGGLAFLIISIAILVAIFRTWLALIGAYVNIILSIIFAPLQLMLDAIPGQNQFAGWLKTILANLLAFPLVALLLALGAALTSIGSQVQNGGSKGFVPPLLGVGDMGAAQSLIGLGILLTIPKAIDILREALKAPAFKYGSAWGEALGAGAATASATGQGIYGNLARPYQTSYDTYEDIRLKASRGGRPMTAGTRPPSASETFWGRYMPRIGGRRT